MLVHYWKNGCAFAGPQPYLDIDQKKAILDLEFKKGSSLLTVQVGKHERDYLEASRTISRMFFVVPFNLHLGVSENGGTPKSSIWVGISIINHPFWGPRIFGNTHLFISLVSTCSWWLEFFVEHESLYGLFQTNILLFFQSQATKETPHSGFADWEICFLGLMEILILPTADLLWFKPKSLYKPMHGEPHRNPLLWWNRGPVTSHYSLFGSNFTSRELHTTAALSIPKIKQFGPENLPFAPKGNDRIPTMPFSGANMLGLGRLDFFMFVVSMVLNLSIAFSGPFTSRTLAKGHCPSLKIWRKASSPSRSSQISDICTYIDQLQCLYVFMMPNKSNWMEDGEISWFMLTQNDFGVTFVWSWLCLSCVLFWQKGLS